MPLTFLCRFGTVQLVIAGHPEYMLESFFRNAECFVQRVQSLTDYLPSAWAHETGVRSLRTVAGQDQTVVRILRLELGKLLPVAFEGQMNVRNSPELHRESMCSFVFA